MCYDRGANYHYNGKNTTILKYIVIYEYQISMCTP